MRILDLFCGEGGAAMGYHRYFPDAEIVGVDVESMPRYPFTFVQADAMTYPLDGFDFIHASPPCQAYSTVSGPSRNGARKEYPDLVAPIRQRLLANGRPFIIENVAGSPLKDTVRLCGSSFGLDVRRHRYFETWPFMALARPCDHASQRPRFRSLDSRQRTPQCVIGVHGHLNYAGERELREQAMGIRWMSDHGITQAIPPSYTEYLSQFIPLDVTR